MSKCTINLCKAKELTFPKQYSWPWYILKAVYIFWSVFFVIGKIYQLDSEQIPVKKILRKITRSVVLVVATN